MSIEDEIIKYQQEIMQLAESLALWSSATVPADVRAKVKEEQDRMLFRLKQLEVEGQKVKIVSMKKALALFKGETDHD